MAYNANIPQPTDPKNVSQAQILENFGQINTVFSVDHATFSSPAGEGKHMMSTYPVNAAAAPGPTELRVYANTSTFTGNPELFLRRNAGNPTQMTSGNLNTNGYSMFPSGLLLKWGSATQNAMTGGPFNFVWPVGGNNIPFSTQLWAFVIPGSDPGDTTKDVNAACYETSVANPLQVSYRVWRRNQFNTAGTDRAPFTVWVLALGIP